MKRTGNLDLPETVEEAVAWMREWKESCENALRRWLNIAGSAFTQWQRVSVVPTASSCLDQTPIQVRGEVVWPVGKEVNSVFLGVHFRLGGYVPGHDITRACWHYAYEPEAVVEVLEALREVARRFQAATVEAVRRLIEEQGEAINRVQLEALAKDLSEL